MESAMLNKQFISKYQREIFPGEILSSKAIAERIDAIIHELEILRSIVATEHSEPAESDLAGKLFGVLGKGRWEEYDQAILSDDCSSVAQSPIFSESEGHRSCCFRY